MLTSLVSRIVLATGLALFLAVGAEARDRVVTLGSRLWRINTKGQILPFSYQFPLEQLGDISGSTAPLPSPDNQWVVFARHHDLCLLHVCSGRERRISKFGRPQGDRYASVETLVTAWSSDSRRILFAIVPGETSGPAEEWGTDLLVRTAPYGFYVYSVATGTSRLLALPKGFRFEAWLPDGSFLGVESQAKPCDERLLMVRSGEAAGIEVGAPAGSPSQVQVSDDGKRVIGYFASGCEEPERAQIVEIDLATKSATLIVPMSAWAQNQSPAFSPGGDHISYTHEEGMVAGIPDESLIVDSRSVYSCHGMINYQWLDGESIAAACQNEVAVLDIATRLAPESLQAADSTGLPIERDELTADR